LLSFALSLPGINDRRLFKKAAGGMDGVFVGDAGYVSKELEKDRCIEGKRIALIKPYKKMKRVATALQTAIYNTRFKIEFDSTDCSMLRTHPLSPPDKSLIQCSVY
jgi:hypothetical protein